MLDQPQWMEEQAQLQTKRARGCAIEITPDLDANLATIQRDGRPLPEAVRAFFAPRFGHVFSDVRIHTDSHAAASAQAINALAFTVGPHIVFGPGQYAPETRQGRRLLAHELAHVMQQGSRDDGRIIRAKNQFEDCSDPQKKRLETNSQLALKSVNRAETYVGSAYGRPGSIAPRTRQLLNAHFHTNHRDYLLGILRNYISVRQALEKGLDFQCETECEIRGNVTTCGYAYATQLFGGLGDVHICFDQRAKGCDFPKLTLDEQEALVIHEAAHRYAGIDDKAYIWQPEYAKLSPAKAVDNADSYAWFALSL